jgi:hypothetical protein
VKYEPACSDQERGKWKERKGEEKENNGGGKGRRKAVSEKEETSLNLPR